jgi:L-2,4-diaminobutyrate decarboxylase
LKLSHKYSYLVNGLETADSIVWDPQKWLYIPKSCGALLLKNGGDFEHVETHAEYIVKQEDSEKGINNIGEKTIQGSKRFDALKLWMSLKHIGTENYGHIIDYSIDLMKYIEQKLKSSDNFVLINKPDINILCFRFIPPKFQEQLRTRGSIKKGELEFIIDKTNEEIEDRLRLGGKAWIGMTTINNHKALRINNLNVYTTKEDIDEVVSLVEEIGFKVLESYKIPH